MSVSKNDGNNSNTQKGDPMADAFGASAGQTGGRQGGNQQRTAGGQPRRPSVLDINATHGRPVSRRSTGELVRSFENAIKKDIDATMGSGYKDNFDVQVFSNTQNLTLLSSILVCLNVKANDGKEHVLVYNLIVEGSGGRRDNKFININGQNVELEWTPGELATEQNLWNKISLFLSETYGKQDLVLHYAGASVLYNETDVEDADAIHKIVYTTTQALYTTMENEVTGAEKPITVSMLDNGATMSATLDMNPTPVVNAFGLPERCDTAIILRGTPINGQSAGYEQTIELTRANAYISIEYAEPQAPIFGQAPITQRYYPRVVLTRLDSEVDAITPELTMLSLATTTLWARQMQWGAVFQPRYGVQGRDLRDIGAIGYEVNLTGDPNAKPERIDTKAQSFGKPQLFQLIQTTIFDQLAFSIDVEDTGELSWLQQMFVAAAAGNTDANAAIVQACNNLTEGAFSRRWQGGQIVANDANRIHLGYYIDEMGNKKDLRDIDYLAMLNLMGDKDMRVVIDWSNSFLDLSIPEPIRLETRSRILRSIFADCRIKGFATRLTFNPEFLTALAQSCSDAGLGIRQNNTFLDFSGLGGRGAFAGQQWGVSGQAVGAMFAYQGQPGFGQGGFRGFGQAAYGRFGGSNV